MKRFSKGFLLLVALGVLMSGCGKKDVVSSTKVETSNDTKIEEQSEPEVSLEKQAYNYFALFGQFDVSNVAEMENGSTIDVAQKQIDKLIDKTMSELEKSFEATTTDEQKQQFKTDLLTAMKRLEPEIEVLNKDDKSATVKFSTKTVRTDLASQRVVEECKEAITSDPTLASDMERYYGIFLEKYGKALNEVELTETSKSVEIEFELKDNTWVISNPLDMNKITKITIM